MRPGSPADEQAAPTRPHTPGLAPAPDDRSGGQLRAPAGILYSASGEQHIAEAVRSARSSLRHNDLPHLLYASSEVQNDDPRLTVLPFEPGSHPFADRIGHMSRSPFERTLYLDSDTYVLDEISPLLALLDHYDVAAAYASYCALDDPAVPSAFYEFNAGVVAWRSSERVAEFLRSWQETYIDWLSSEPFPGTRHVSRSGRGDQPAFRHCAWQHGIRLFVLPPEYNFRAMHPTTLREMVRIIHARHDDYESLAEQVNWRRGLRSWPRETPLRTKTRRLLWRATGWRQRSPA
jgi:hypothetical protein